NVITTSGAIASSDPMAANTESLRFENAYLADLQVNPGNSGGPVFAADARTVIGLCIATYNAPVVFADGQREPASGVQLIQNGPGQHQIQVRPIVTNSGIADVIPSEYIIALLEAHGTTYTLAKPIVPKKR